jgi:hypothetical protein
MPRVTTRVVDHPPGAAIEGVVFDAGDGRARGARRTATLKPDRPR